MPKKEPEIISMRSKIIKILKEGFGTCNYEQMEFINTKCEELADQILAVIEKEKLERFNTSDKTQAEQEVLDEIKDLMMVEPMIEKADSITQKGWGDEWMKLINKVKSWQEKLCLPNTNEQPK